MDERQAMVEANAYQMANARRGRMARRGGMGYQPGLTPGQAAFQTAQDPSMAQYYAAFPQMGYYGAPPYYYRAPMNWMLGEPQQLAPQQLAPQQPQPVVEQQQAPEQGYRLSPRLQQ
jgi:hypothetical protein